MIFTPWQGGYKYFPESEMCCKCGCGALPKHEFMLWLVTVREEYGYPMIITSGARCEKHNKAEGGADDSAHLDGLAADTKVFGLRAMLLLAVALKHGVHGVGLMQKGAHKNRFMHLDLGELGGGRLWTY